jgi:hypothetical protein
MRRHARRAGTVLIFRGAGRMVEVGRDATRAPTAAPGRLPGERTDDMTRSERLWMLWQRVVAAAFVLAIAATPILAIAQGAGREGGGAGGGTGSGGPPPGGTGAGGPAGGAPGGEGGGGRGLAWIAIILAIAVVIYLFTRRRGRAGTVQR